MNSTDTPLDIDRLMREIRADIAARLPEHGEADPFVGGADAFGARGEAWQPSAPPRLGRIGELAAVLPEKSDYHVDEFLAYHDEDFVRTAYRALLGREPDPEGALRYLAKIRSGELSRIEVLGRIRFSPEGRAANVRLRGLALRFGARTARRIPLLGRLFGIVQYAWRLPDLARNHEILEDAVFANREDLRRRINAIVADIEQALLHLRTTQSEPLANADRLRAQLDAVEKDVAVKVDRTVIDRRLGDQQAALDQRFREQQTSLDQRLGEQQAAVSRGLGEFRAALLDAGRSAQGRDAKLADIAERLRANVAEVARNARTLDALRDANEALGRRFAQMVPVIDLATLIAATERANGDLRRIANALDDARTRRHPRDAVGTSRDGDLANLLDAVQATKAAARSAADDAANGRAIAFPEGFYVAFEDRFRGTREDIKQRVAVYLSPVRAAGAGSREAPVLDIGCGRGEWLELLHEHGLAASGVDVNDVAVAGCRARGLEAIVADGIDHLRRLPPDSLGAVSAIHVIEHLPFARLIGLFDEAHRVLRPGGLVIFETPNPENLIVGACSFYYDPTHLRPLPPEPFRFILEARGFERVEIMRLHPDAQAPDPGPEPGELMRVISERFFGARDYALVGFKA